MMVDLDSRKIEGGRPKPDGELEEIQIGKESGQTTRINKNLPTVLKQDLATFLRTNADLFAWTTADVPEIHVPPTLHLPRFETSGSEEKKNKPR